MSVESKMVLHGTIYLLMFGIFAGLTVNFYFSQDFGFAMVSFTLMIITGLASIFILMGMVERDNKRREK